MLLAPTELRSSPISGIGLFALVSIKKGLPVWKYNSETTIIMNPKITSFADYSAMKTFLDTYGYLGKGHDRLKEGFYIQIDNARFMNHSDHPNIEALDGGDVYVAARDIEAGEEILCDYAEHSEPGDFDFVNYNREPKCL